MPYYRPTPEHQGAAARLTEMVTMAKYDDDYARLAQRFEHAMAHRPPRVLTPRNSAWMSRTGLAWWIGYALHEPREAAYCIPRRIACRLLMRHNSTCVGKPAPHPRRW